MCVLTEISIFPLKKLYLLISSKAISCYKISNLHHGEGQSGCFMTYTTTCTCSDTLQHLIMYIDVIIHVHVHVVCNSFFHRCSLAGEK